MSQANPEQQRTLVNAKKALRFIAEHRLAADPNTYQVIYTYVSRIILSLNDEIDAIVESGKRMTQAQADELHERTFASVAQVDSIDGAGEKVTTEIAKVMALLNAVIVESSANAGVLDRVRIAIGCVSAPDGLNRAIKILTTTAQKMQGEYSELLNNLMESQREIERLQEDLQIVRQNSLRDPLTKVYNRKFFDDTLAKAVCAASSEGTLALLMIDIDHFKQFNDGFGHIVGDQVLRVVGNLLLSNTMGKDTVARYGGEEFGIILPDTTLQDADHVANTIRRSVMTKELQRKSTGETLGRITLSIGVAVFRHGDTPESLITRADQGLYAAKRRGRNRVICETDPELEHEIRAA